MDPAAEHVAWLIGNQDSGNFLFVDESLNPQLTPAMFGEWAKKGFGYIGVVGILNGKPVNVLDVVLEDRHMRELGLAYAGYVMGRLGVVNLEAENA